MYFRTYSLFLWMIALLAWITISAAHALTPGGQTFFPLNVKAMKNRVINAEPFEVKEQREKNERPSRDGFMALDRQTMNGLRISRSVASFRKKYVKEGRVMRSKKEKETNFVSSDEMIVELFGDERVDEEHPFAKRIAGMEHRWPIPGGTRQRISSEFGERPDPFTGKKDFHEGIDIAARKGTKVLATAKGTVLGVGRHPRLGNYVKIDHGDGITTQYGHLKEIRVKGGQNVRAGQQVGTVGSTGRSTGPHLDYSLRIDGEAIDPLMRLQVPAKLKPVEFSSVIP